MVLLGLVGLDLMHDTYIVHMRHVADSAAVSSCSEHWTHYTLLCAPLFFSCFKYVLLMILAAAAIATVAVEVQR
jgi:hypothetical protein